MLNAEKFKDEINEEYLNLLKRNVIDGDGNRMNKAIKTIAFKHCGKQLCGASSTFKWLCEEYKEPVKLSRLEYEILKWAKKEGYKYITRDEDCELCTFQSEPEKLNIAWDCCDVYTELPLFKKSFQFIQWADEKPTLIQSILDNCEVVEDESK